MRVNCPRSQSVRLRRLKLLHWLHVGSRLQILSTEAHMGTERLKEARLAKNGLSLDSGSPDGEAGQSGAALRAFFAIADKWGLSAREQRNLLGGPPRSTFSRWKTARRGRLGPDALDRISYILGIYLALHQLFPEPNQADGWVRRPNAYFNGCSALQRMLAGGMTDLHVVRQFLDSRLG